MPRPGPRPYECVRRSWHSDRHQPIRGSIIQQIFRVVHENHSTGTKKNREWQEKLPLVVFKSEEIMYSKANSEAEYIDPETLWDRLNDAISTIIRKDESLETGEFLPPCVEAALNLGCVPVRSSRSERNSNTRSYLGTRNQDPKPIETATNSQNLENPNIINQTRTFSKTNRDARQNYQIAPPRPSFYPLYHGIHFQPQNLSPIITSTPFFQTVHDPLQSGWSEPPRPSLVECDLSLRLGLGLTRVKDVDLGQSSSISGSRNKEFAFFPLNSESEQVRNVRKRDAESVNNNNVVEGERCLLQLEPDLNWKRRGL